MALFTGKGDKGTTKLFNSKSGERISKNSTIFEALGSVDELNSFLGLCKVAAREPGFQITDKGLSFEKIIHSERKGTAQSLAKHGRPNGTLHIPSISPESLGALFQFYELATAYMGELLGVNTYNQPGVEEGKMIAKKLLK